MHFAMNSRSKRLYRIWQLHLEYTQYERMILPKGPPQILPANTACNHSLLPELQTSPPLTSIHV